MNIPRDFIDLVLTKIDIVDFIDGRVPLRKKTGSNFFACCPFHQEKSPSFSVSQTKQFYYCFGCGAHGNAIDFLIQYDRLSFPEAIENLAKHAGLEIPASSKPRDKQVSHTVLHELLETISHEYQTQLREHPRAIEYLKKRGLTGTIAKEFGIGFAPNSWDHVLHRFGKSATEKQQLLDIGMVIKKDDGSLYDRFRDRIQFPIHNRQGKIIGFGGRIIDHGEPKYLNSPETVLFQKGHELYGLYHALKRNRQLSQVLIVEGYMDVIALFQNEISYAVATLGTATTANHLQRLFRYTSEIIFCFDGDNAGRTAAWRALQVTLPAMRDGVQIRFMFLPEGEDPDTLIRKEGKNNFEQRMKNSPTLSQYFFQAMAQQADLNTMDGRARFVKLATEHLQHIPDGIFKQMMFDELAKRARVDVAQLTNPAAKIAYSAEKNSAKKPPSALRLAMVLLIQHPALAKLVTQSLPHLELSGYELFQKCFALAQHHPEMTTGILLEHWRDQPEQAMLAKLAQQSLTTPENGIAHEFLGAIEKLKKLAQQQFIEKLLAKAALGELSGEEKMELQRMMKNKVVKDVQ